MCAVLLVECAEVSAPCAIGHSNVKFNFDKKKIKSERENERSLAHQNEIKTAKRKRIYTVCLCVFISCHRPYVTVEASLLEKARYVGSISQMHTRVRLKCLFKESCIPFSIRLKKERKKKTE